MSKEPVSTIIRSDAPHLVEVKPGSLNASSTKSWVEAGEVKPEDNIAVVALPDEAPNRQAVNAGAAGANHQAAVEAAAGQANRQKLADDAVASNRAALPDDALEDQRAALPPTAPLTTHHEPVPESGALTDHHEPLSQDHIQDHQEPVSQDHIQDHQEPVSQGKTQAHREPVDASHSHDHVEPAQATHGLADGPEIAPAPTPSSVPSSAPAAAHEAAMGGQAHPGEAKPSKSVAPFVPVASARPQAVVRKMDHATAAVHLTHDPEAFKSRVAAIRDSVSHITDQLDHLEKKH
ncbi:MAG: hypothetical protein EBV20_02105 [Betaproteobacteria bacterium]|jgi:hypothetical protein|nr:hypothetical protein [Betaproteobacteria bacterium]